jgi:hypothetical protein
MKWKKTINFLWKVKTMNTNENIKPIMTWQGWLNYWNDMQVWYLQVKVKHIVQDDDSLHCIPKDPVKTISYPMLTQAKQINFLRQVSLKRYKAIKLNKEKDV